MTSTYYQQNKEKLKKKSRERYYAKKESLCKKVTCECGSVLSAQNMNYHLKTKLHARRYRTVILRKFILKHLSKTTL